MRLLTRNALAFACCAAAACGRARTSTPKGSASSPAAAALLRFQPPADEILTDAQLERYVRVRRAARGRSDREAARAVGVDPDEFVWVRARVLEAVVALQTSRVRSAAEGTYARTLAALRESRRSARDPQTARTLDEQIAGLERERGTLRKEEPLPASVAANARKVAARRAEIDAAPP